MTRNKTGISRLLQIAGEKRRLLLVSGVVSSVSALCMLVPYIAVYFILRELLHHAAHPIEADRGLMIGWGATALAGMLGGLLTTYIGGMCSHIAAFRILYGLRVKLAAHIGRLPLGFLSKTSTGAVKKTLEQNVEKVETFIAHQLPDMVHVMVTALVMLAAMLYLNPWLALACIVPMVLSFAAQASMMMGQGAKESVKMYYDSLENINASAIQYVRGMPAVKVFGQTVHSFRRFYDDMIRYRDYCLVFTDQFQNGFIVFKVILGSFVTFVLPVGVYLLSGDPEDVSFAVVLLFFLIMAPGVSAPMFKFIYLASGLRDIGEGVTRIDAILAQQPVAETSAPQLPHTYDIEFDQVSFSYNPSSSTLEKVSSEIPGGRAGSPGVNALTGIAFRARQGEITALVGPSGSGKSTIANLIPRFWDVQSGAVRIGGVDIRDMATADLMNTVAFVFQDTFLFHDTLRANIQVGRPGASEDEVYAAAKAAQCHEFILQLPAGYDTLIGQGGVYLSGGEEQRIAVARAILKNAPILVLDEATAYADPENEYEMQAALKELMRGKTVIVIAHRLSSIREAEQILVLLEGSIAQRGTHEQLIAADGLYKQMWEAYVHAGQWKINKGGVLA